MKEGELFSSIPSLNIAFKGTEIEGALVHVYGPFQSGKTLLMLQLIYELVGKLNGNALYVDTEASFRCNFSKEMNARYASRFGKSLAINDVHIVKSAPVKGGKKKSESEIRRIFETVLDELNIEYDREDLYDAIRTFLKKVELDAAKAESNTIYLLDTVDLETLLSLLNVDADIEKVGEKTEVKINKINDPLQGPISKFIRSHRIKIVVLDSIGMLIKSLAISLADLPARASVMNLIIGAFIRLASNYRLVVFAVNHESRSPLTNQYTFYGGNPVGYGFKYSLYLGRQARSKPHLRELVVERAPLLPEKSIVIKLQIREDGFHEVAEGEQNDED